MLNVELNNLERVLWPNRIALKLLDVNQRAAWEAFRSNLKHGGHVGVWSTNEWRFSQRCCWRRLVGCDAVLLGDQFRTFRVIVILPSSGSDSPTRWTVEPEDEVNTIRRAVWNYSPNNTASHPWTLEFSSKFNTIFC